MTSKRQRTDDMVSREEVRFAVAVTPVLLLIIGCYLYFGILYDLALVPNCFICSIEFMGEKMICLLVITIWGTVLLKTWREIL